MRAIRPYTEAEIAALKSTTVLKRKINPRGKSFWICESIGGYHKIGSPSGILLGVYTATSLLYQFVHEDGRPFGVVVATVPNIPRKVTAEFRPFWKESPAPGIPCLVLVPGDSTVRFYRWFGESFWQDTESLADGGCCETKHTWWAPMPVDKDWAIIPRDKL